MIKPYYCIRVYGCFAETKTEAAVAMASRRFDGVQGTEMGTETEMETEMGAAGFAAGFL